MPAIAHELTARLSNPEKRAFAIRYMIECMELHGYDMRSLARALEISVRTLKRILQDPAFKHLVDDIDLKRRQNICARMRKAREARKLEKIT